MMKKQLNFDDISSFMLEYSHRVVGPVMYRYTAWVISEALKRGFKKLYFLARDGFVLHKIAKKICENMNIDIQCEYLYCSRQSLRTPTYNLIGDEAFELLSLGGYYVTPLSILDRPQLSLKAKSKIIQELGIDNFKTPLTASEIEEFCNKLKHNNTFVNSVYKASEKAYLPTIQYLLDMGLFDNDYVAIVDSGWTGSMQRSLRQLMESAGYHGKITGFYFGMYAEPKDERDGEYLTFYFNNKNGLFRKINFNNNLFECMLSADHPMTLGYTCEKEKCKPIFAKENKSDMQSLIKAQLEGALLYTDEMLSKGAITPLNFNFKKARAKCYSILKRAMTKPTIKEAEMYGIFTFCDDVTEGYQIPLSQSGMKKALRDYIVVIRIARKLFGLKKANEKQLLWPHGTVAHLKPVLRPWYRLNIYIWEFLKATLKK